MAVTKQAAKYRGEGASGGCYFEIYHIEDGRAHMDVGWSCVVVHDRVIPVTWLAEVIAIVTSHKGGIAGFLEEAAYGGPSYALACDPAPTK